MAKYRCTGNGVRIRTGPSTNHSIVGSLYKGDEVSGSNINGNWLEHDRGGWSSLTYLQMIAQDTSGTTSNTPPAQTITEQVNGEAYDQRAEVDLDELDNTNEYDDYPDEASSLWDMVYTDRQFLNDLEGDMKSSTARGIHGMPYQFLPIVDNRMNLHDTDSFGRKFGEKIVARMPILILTPGVPKFMAGYSKQTRRDIIADSISRAGGGGSAGLENLLDKDGRYYSFQMDYKNYFAYVNAMMRALAIYMGIGEERLNGVKLKNFDWYDDIEADLSKLIRYTKCVAFYIDSDKQISENFSNDTGDSMLKSTINGLSDYAREAQFLMGTSSYAMNSGVLANGVNAMGSDNLSQNIEEVNNFIDKVMLGDGNIFSRITSNIQTLVAGGKMVFPEIWTDSGRGGSSFDISIKLTCPDPTPMGLLLDIMLPIALVVCMTAPRAATPNGYVSPFLVRGFYKGMFNVDMGIITSLNITKGAEGSWSREGIPTVAEINFTIKDLYSSLAISKDESGKNGIINNIALLDYLANMAGINVNEFDIWRQVELYLAFNGFTRIRDALKYDIFRGFEQWKDNFASNIWKNLIR